MTVAEYEKRYRAAKISIQLQQLQTDKILKNIYISASEKTAKVVEKAKYLDASSLTLKSQQAIEKNLTDLANEIAGKLTTPIQESMSEAYSTMSLIDNEYVSDAAKQAGAMAISMSGMNNVAVVVNDDLVRAVVARLYGDGKTFSERVWKASAIYEDKISQIVAEGVARGRSTVDIAQDITQYTADGKVKLAKRWGNMGYGSKSWLARMPKNLDYRAVRLARTEVAQGLQSAGVRQAVINPGATDMVEWKLTPGMQHDCVCIDYANVQFYKIDEVPAYPHVSCYCSINPVLRPQGELVDELKRWANGEFVPNIEAWHRNIYLPAQG